MSIAVFVMGYQSFMYFSDYIHVHGISLPVLVWLAHHQSWVGAISKMAFGAYGENLINFGTLAGSCG